MATSGPHDIRRRFDMTSNSSLCLRVLLSSFISVYEVFILFHDWALERDQCPNSNLRMFVVANLYLKLGTLDSIVIAKHRPPWAKFAILPVFLGWIGYEINGNVCSAMTSSMLFNYVFYLFWIVVAMAIVGALCLIGMAAVAVVQWLFASRGPSSANSPLAVQMAPAVQV